MIRIVIILSITILFYNGLQAQRSTLQKQSKRENGLFIFDDQLKEIFPSANVKYVDKIIKSSLENTFYNQTNYIILVRTFYPLTQDLIALKDFIKEGNNVMISASFFNQTTYDFFNFETNIKDSIGNALLFTEKTLLGLDSIQSKYTKGIINSFENFNKQKFTILGKNTNGSANFIKLKIGKGNLFIHLYPDVFTNGFIVDKLNYNYTESLLSYLPKYSGQVLIKLAKPNANDSYRGGKGSSENDVFAFVKNEPNLWAAVLVGLACFGLVVLFGLKRRQRLIEVHPPIKNTTMEFAKTMGDLYYNSKNNNDIATKKIQYWQEHIRTKYQIATNKMEKEFWEKIAKKTTASTELVHQLERNIIQVRSGAPVSDKLLIQLSNQIDQFYKS